jgi:hypothetical protein
MANKRASARPTSRGENHPPRFQFRDLTIEIILLFRCRQLFPQLRNFGAHIGRSLIGMLTVGRNLADRAWGPPRALNRAHQKRIDRRLNDRCGTVRPEAIASFFETLCVSGELIVTHHDGFAIACDRIMLFRYRK